MAYYKTQSERDLKALEENNVVQLATLDIIFSQRLRWVIENLDEITTIVDPKTKEEREVQVITSQHIFELFSQANRLRLTKLPARNRVQVNFIFADVGGQGIANFILSREIEYLPAAPGDFQ